MRRKLDYRIEAGGDGFEEVRELGFFTFGKFGEDEVDIADFFSQSVISCPEAKPWEVLGAKILNDRFKTVVAAGGAMSALTDFTELEVEIVADDKNILWRDLIKVGKSADGCTDIVIKSLGFNNDGIALFLPDGIKFLVRFPLKAFNLEIKIKRQKAEVVASEVIFGTWVAKSDDKFHKKIIPQRL